MPRFTIIPAPLEERVATSISTQARAAAQSARRLLDAVHSQRATTLSRTHAFLSDEARVHHILTTAATLLLPTQLPGLLLAFALVLYAAHAIALRTLAHRAVRAAGLKRR